MAQIQGNTRKRKPRSSSNGSFLACFGFSRKVPEKNPVDMDMVKPRGRKKARWFSWARLQMKKADVKTVPIDAAVSVAANRRRPIHPENKNNSKQHIPATGARASNIPATLQDEIIGDKPQKTRHEADQKIILEVHENSNDVDSQKDVKCPKRLSFGQKTETRKTGGGHPGSPQKKSKPGRIIKTSSHSVSYPAPKGEKQVKLLPESDTLAGKLDPIVGMSILMVTLVILLLWGRLCAVLCTSAWFYFVPRLRVRSGRVLGSNVSEENGSNQIDLDFNYEEYKKKVVLEGFLERKRRIPMQQ